MPVTINTLESLGADAVRALDGAVLAIRALDRLARSDNGTIGKVARETLADIRARFPAFIDSLLGGE